MAHLIFRRAMFLLYFKNAMKKKDNFKSKTDKSKQNLNKKGKKLGGVVKSAIKIMKGKEGGKKYMKKSK